jgi:hypothetical protein
LRLQCCLLFLSLQSQFAHLSLLFNNLLPQCCPPLLFIIKSSSYFLNLKCSSNPSLFHGGRANASNHPKSPRLDNFCYCFSSSLSWFVALRFSDNLFHVSLKRK